MAEDNHKQSPKASLPEHILCPTCGALAERGQRFCGQCGAPLQRVCPACGAQNPAGNRFCGTCGSLLATQSVSQSTREERRWITALFADVSGFTAMSEHMDPEDVKVMADRWANRLSEEVRRFGGTVINVVGDEVFATFGAPVAHEDDAERAVRAGLAMRSLNLSDDPEHPIRVHVGIYTGEGMAGWIGPEGRRDYTVMGDTVNTAARLLSAATSGSVLVGESTHRETQELVRYQEVAPVTAKGKEKPVPAWEALEMIAAPRARPLGTAPLIGRENELGLLENIWLRVSKDSQPHLVTILGEPGVGKSRLVAEFERQLPNGVAVWHGRCQPYGEALGYWALAMALKEASGIMAEDEAEESRAKLEDLVAGVPELGSDLHEVARHLALLSGLDVEADRSAGAGDQRVLHTSARHFLEAFARKHPLCLIFDDIHWADDALIELIESVAARVHEAPLLIITEARPELIEKRRGWGRSIRSFTSLPLGSLSEASERELVESLCRERGIPMQLVMQIGRSPGGNPLFAEQLVAMMAEGGSLTGVPSVIKALIAARLDTLPGEEKTVIQLAAVFGKQFWESGLKALDGRVADNLADLLERLEQKDLLRLLPGSQFRDNHEYVFKHDLIREVAYDLLPKSERRSLHGRAAEALEAQYHGHTDDITPQLAHHYQLAGDNAKAIEYLSKAGDAAARAYAQKEAAAYYAQALDLASQAGISAEQRTALYLRRGRALELDHQFGPAAQLYDEMLTVARAQGEHRMELAGLLAAGTLRSVISGVPDAQMGEALSTRALELALEMGDHAAQAKALWNLMLVSMYLKDDPARAMGYGEQALALAREMDLREQMAYVTTDLGHACTLAGRLDEAEIRLTEADPLWREVGNLPMLGFNLDLLMVALLLRGKYEALFRVGAEGPQLGNTLHDLWASGPMLLFQSFALLEQGEVGRALETLQESLPTLEGEQRGNFLELAHALLFWSYMIFGKTETAQETYREVRKPPEAISRHPYQAWTLALYALYEVASGQLQAAEATLGTNTMRRAAVGAVWLDLAGCQLAYTQGDFRGAAEMATETIRHMQQFGTMHFLPDLYYVKGQAHAGLGEQAEAREALQAGAEAAEALGARRILWQILAALADEEQNAGEAASLRARARETVSYVAANAGPLEQAFRALPAVQALLTNEVSSS